MKSPTPLTNGSSMPAGIVSLATGRMGCRDRHLHRAQRTRASPADLQRLLRTMGANVGAARRRPHVAEPNLLVAARSRSRIGCRVFTTRYRYEQNRVCGRQLWCIGRFSSRGPRRAIQNNGVDRRWLFISPDAAWSRCHQLRAACDNTRSDARRQARLRDAAGNISEAAVRTVRNTVGPEAPRDLRGGAREHPEKRSDSGGTGMARSSPRTRPDALEKPLNSTEASSIHLRRPKGKRHFLVATRRAGLARA